MRMVPVGEAARSLNALLKAAESGEEVIITRAGKPIAKLIGVTARAEPNDPSNAPERPRMRSIGFRNHS